MEGPEILGAEEDIEEGFSGWVPGISGEIDVNEEHLRHCMLYECKKSTSAAQATRNICSVYGNNVLNVSTCQRCFAKISSGNFDLKDSPRSGRPKSIDQEALKGAVEVNPKSTSRELSQLFNTTHTNIISSLHSLRKVSKLRPWVPHDLTDNQRNQKLTICTSLFSRNSRHPFLERIITGDEKWVLYNNTQRKRQWLRKDQSPTQFQSKDYTQERSSFVYGEI
ncbi:histone-lysine N-methyltransferase SETMAR-like [Oratosquilla oratoria]|uniref:histone-lysine N-methyltransferase SETMAR-like n=1 Tax=Oratosquilla oratoria TaxID=337810 RepID=UPI003F771471